MNTDDIAVQRLCRVCSGRIDQVLDLGESTLANDFCTLAESSALLAAPLDLLICKQCSTVQLGHTVKPEKLFRNYRYQSGASGNLRQHFQEYAKETSDKIELMKGAFVVGIGGNDGVLEQAYQTLGFKVLNIEPSHTVAAMSECNVPTHCGWFNRDTAANVVRQYGKADVITCNNCFAHMPDIEGVMNGIKTLLKPDGCLIVESSYLGKLATVDGLWDQIYHEHVFYWSLQALLNLFEEWNMTVMHFEMNNQQGGSFRCYVSNIIRDMPVEISERLLVENRLRLDSETTYAALFHRLKSWQQHGRGFLSALKEAGKTLSCYGAPAKLNMISRFLNLREHAEYVVDDSPMKCGLFTPDAKLEVVNRQYFQHHPTDFCLITSAPHVDMIVRNNPAYPGKWLAPYPFLHSHL